MMHARLFPYLATVTHASPAHPTMCANLALMPGPVAQAGKAAVLIAIIWAIRLCGT